MFRDPGTSPHRGAAYVIKVLATVAGAALLVWIFVNAPLVGLLLVGISMMSPQFLGKRSER